jgi:hypothetical protein
MNGAEMYKKSHNSARKSMKNTIKSALRESLIGHGILIYQSTILNRSNCGFEFFAKQTKRSLRDAVLCD